MANYTQNQRLMSVATPLGADVLLLTGLSGTESISHLFSFQLDLLAENKKKSQVLFEKLLGAELTVRVNVPGGPPRYFGGICSQFSQGNQDSNFTVYQAEIVPQFWLLTRKTCSRIFQHLSVPEILKQVLDGLKVTYHCVREHERREYCVQYRETDFDFASRLMEEEGIYYFFKHSEHGHEMVVSDTNVSHQPVSAPATVRYDMNETAEASLRVREWIKRQELRPGKVTLWDSNFQLPGKNFQAERQPPAEVAIGSVTHKLQVGGNSALEIYEHPGGYAKRFDGVTAAGADQPARLQKIFEENDRTARLRMEAESAAAVVIEGASNCPQFATGSRFTLTHHFDAPGNYVFRSISHVARSGDAYRSSQNEPFSYQNTFVCFPSHIEFRPLRVTPKPIVHGVQTAFVVGPKGKEVYIDKFGRAKVQFQWDREGQRNEHSSCWIRSSQTWAGKLHGGVNHPRIGQEVIIDFEEGDPDRPIITGRVHNPAHMPPPSNAGREDSKVRRSREKATAKKQNAADIKQKRVARKSQAGAPGPIRVAPSDPILSGAEARMPPVEPNPFNEFPPTVVEAFMMSSFRSDSLDGHAGSNEITMNDAGGEEGLFVKAQKDNINTIGNDRETTVTADDLLMIGVDRVKTIGNDETVEIGHDRQKIVGNDETVEVGNDRHKTVRNNEDTEIGTDRTEQVGSNESITIGNDRTEKVGGNEGIDVIGSRKRKVGKDESVDVIGKRVKKIGKDEDNTITGSRSNTIGGSETRKVAGVRAVIIKGNDSLTVSEGAHTVTVSAGTQTTSVAGAITITSPTSLTCQVGGSQLILIPQGIRLSIGGSSIEMTGDGIKVLSPRIDLNL